MIQIKPRRARGASTRPWKRIALKIPRDWGADVFYAPLKKAGAVPTQPPQETAAAIILFAAAVDPEGAAEFIRRVLGDDKKAQRLLEALRQAEYI